MIKKIIIYCGGQISFSAIMSMRQNIEDKYGVKATNSFNASPESGKILFESEFGESSVDIENGNISAKVGNILFPAGVYHTVSITIPEEGHLDIAQCAQFAKDIIGDVKIAKMVAPIPNEEIYDLSVDEEIEMEPSASEQRSTCERCNDCNMCPYLKGCPMGESILKERG